MRLSSSIYTLSCYFTIHKLMKLYVLFWGRRQEDGPRAFPLAPSAQDLHLCGLSLSCNDLGLDGHIKPQVMKNLHSEGPAWRSSSPAGSCSSDKRLSASASQGLPRRNQVFIRWGSLLTRGPDQKNAKAGRSQHSQVQFGACLYIHIYIHTRVLACMHTCLPACMHACIHACLRACMDACIHACLRACMHACMHACRHTYIHAYIHTFIHT